MRPDDQIMGVLPGPLIDDATEFVFIGDKQQVRAFVNADKHEEVVNRHVARANRYAEALRFIARAEHTVGRDAADVARAALDAYEGKGTK